jgi:hypothetical protein
VQIESSQIDSDSDSDSFSHHRATRLKSPKMLSSSEMLEVEAIEFIRMSEIKQPDSGDIRCQMDTIDEEDEDFIFDVPLSTRRTVKFLVPASSSEELIESDWTFADYMADIWRELKIFLRCDKARDLSAQMSLTSESTSCNLFRTRQPCASITCKKCYCKKCYCIKSQFDEQQRGRVFYFFLFIQKLARHSSYHQPMNVGENVYG